METNIQLNLVFTVHDFNINATVQSDPVQADLYFGVVKTVYKGVQEVLVNGESVTIGDTARIDLTGYAFQKNLLSLSEIVASRVGIPEYDPQTYKITFRTSSGASAEIDLPIEQIGLTYNPQTKEITFMNSFEQIQSIPLVDFVDIYVGSLGDNVQIVVDSGNVIRATILDGTIGFEKLNLELRDYILQINQLAKVTIKRW